MNFESEKICLNQIVSQKEENFSTEDNIIIPDIKPDILSTINSSGNVYVYKKEIVNGKLRIDGGVQVYIMYIADNEENSIRGLHTVIDFSQSIELEDVTNEMDFCCNLSIKNIECKILNGRKINIKVNLNAKIDIYSNTEKELLKSINNMEKVQMISNQVNVNSLKGKGETVATAKDTVTIDDNLADILDTDICVKNKDIKISYNKVLSKADVIIEILYLTDDERINTVTAQIPIMGFIDINGISDNEICNTMYEVRNINIKADNTEEHSIYIEVEFLISCNAYENKEINLIQDLYSPEEEITMNQEEICLIQNKNIIQSDCNIQNRVNIPELRNGKVYNVKVIPNIVKENVLKNVVSYEGELIINILYESSVTNKMEIRSERVAFTHDISSEVINKSSEFNTDIEINSKDFICTPDNTVEINITMKFLLDTYEKNNISIVNNINIEPVKDECMGNSLVIYFVKEGDTLWKIAKKFRSTVDEIAQINNIENIDKINIGDQLYIPKYVYNRVS